MQICVVGIFINHSNCCNLKNESNFCFGLIFINSKSKDFFGCMPLSETQFSESLFLMNKFDDE